MASQSLKIVVMGLDNAGKTSILLSIARQYDPLKIKPTIGADRSLIDVLGFKITRLDLGGQEEYRNTYLDEHSEILLSTDLLIYVIDIQDEARFSESVSYFDDISNFLIEKKEKPQIVIYLHKADPEYLKNVKGQKAIRELIYLFKDRISRKLISFFITSVFNKDTLMYAFSQSIFRLFPKPNLINNFLFNFIEKHGIDAVFTYDHNFIHIGSAIHDDPAKSHAILQSLHRIYMLFEALVKVSEEGYILRMDLLKKESIFDIEFTFRRVLLQDGPIYLVLVGQDIKELESKLTELKQKFEAVKSELSED